MKPAEINRLIEVASLNNLGKPNLKTQTLNECSTCSSASFESIELEPNTFTDSTTINDSSKSASPFTTCNLLTPSPVSLPRNHVISMRGITRPGKPPLKDFSMAVEEGILYGLVGPVGCGKSVVLSLIVGLKEVKGKTTGKLSILGDNPRKSSRRAKLKSIGFMPQEIALYEDLSITETFAFYGRLYGMTRVDVNSRRDFLVKLFGLQVNSICVGKMSRADKSLFGLAVTLLHHPQIIVLDEPFAFMDPIMKSMVLQSISKMTSEENVTFVIATRSVEDAATSNMVGLMREGRMIIELSPAELLTMSTSSLFTDAYFTIYKANDSGRDTKYLKDDDHSEGLKGVSNFNRPAFSLCLDLSSGNRILSVVWINLISLVRKWMMTLFLVVCPTLIILIPWILFYDVIKPLEMGYVNLENVYSEPCFRPVNLNHDANCDFHRLSCQFLSILSNSVLHLTEYATEELAREALRNGEIWGFIQFPQKYSDYFRMRYERKFDITGVIEGSSIFVEMDMTNNPVTSRIRTSIHQSYLQFWEGLYLACNQQAPPETGIPVQYRAADYGSGPHHDHTLEEFLIPGLLVASMYFIPMCTFSLQQLEESRNGLYKKKRMAGVSYWEVLISAWVKEIVVTIFRLGLCLPVIFVGFRIEPIGSLASVICTLLLVSLAGVAVGLAIALIYDNCEISTMGFVFIGFVQNMLFAGILWPRELASTFQYYVSSFLPCTLTAEALRFIISRGWSVSHSAVWPGIVNPLVLILVSCILIFYYEITSTK